MSKKFFSLVLVAVLTACYAHAQMSFGVRAGFNLTNFAEKDWDGKKPEKDDKSKFKPGFQIGVVAELPIGDVLSFQPGLIFAQQGAKYEYDGWDDFGNPTNKKVETSMTTNYLQIPLNFQYKLDLGGMNLFLQAGPYIGYGLSGKFKVDGKDVTKDALGDEKFFGGDKDKNFAKPLDFGLGLGAGLQFDAIQVGIGYNIGLSNIEHGPDDSDYKGSTKNNGLAITLTYFFGN